MKFGAWQQPHLAQENKDSQHMLGSVLGRTDFLRIFMFQPPNFFPDFLAGFFLLIFVGKSAQKNPPGKSPAKSSKIYTTKIPDTFLQRGRAAYGGSDEAATPASSRRRRDRDRRGELEKPGQLWTPECRKS